MSGEGGGREASDDGSIRTHTRRTARTARFAVVGAEPDAAAHLWIVLHGYGQLATRFLRPFVGIVPPDTCVVAPEALSRFYLEHPRADGAHLQRIGASWLTREARDNEIADALGWLTQLQDEVVGRATRGTGAAPTLNVLGFSQGVATMMRWLAHGGSAPAHVVLWAGGLAHDVEMASLRDALAHARITVVAGTSDHFATDEAQAAVRAGLDALGRPIEHIAFDGAHHLDAAVLRTLLTRPSSVSGASPDVAGQAAMPSATPRAVLLHGGSPMWRRDVRASLVERLRVGAQRDDGVVVLLSSVDAEAAKWLADPRLVLVVAVDDAQLRASIEEIAPRADVLWLSDTDHTRSAASVADVIVQRLDATTPQ